MSTAQALHERSSGAAAAPSSQPERPGVVAAMFIAAHNGARIWGGAERATVQLLAGLQSRGHRVLTEPPYPIEIAQVGVVVHEEVPAHVRLLARQPVKRGDLVGIVFVVAPRFEEEHAIPTTRQVGRQRSAASTRCSPARVPISQIVEACPPLFVCDVLGLTSAATIDDGSAYADQLAAVFAASFPETCDGTITAEEAVTVGQTDFTGVLENIAADGPEFLYFPIFVAEGALITQQARETAGLDDTILGGADGILPQDWVAASGDAANGVYLSGPDLAFSGDFYADEFLPAYTEVSGEDEPISVFHAHAFDAYNMLAQAIEEVAFTDGGTTYIPRTELRDAFFSISGFEGITGSLSCDENGDCADAKISVSEVVDGAFERIWPEE